jgi:hypothetical protein
LVVSSESVPSLLPLAHSPPATGKCMFHCHVLPGSGTGISFHFQAQTPYWVCGILFKQNSPRPIAIPIYF